MILLTNSSEMEVQFSYLNLLKWKCDSPNQLFCNGGVILLTNLPTTEV